MIVFGKLWVLLANRGMKRSDLREVISSATIAKMGKNESITTDTIDRLCEFLECQPSDIMEYMTEQQMKDLQTKLDEKEKQVCVMTQQLAKVIAALGYDTDSFEDATQKGIGEVLEKAKDGKELSTEEFNELLLRLAKNVKKTE